MTNEKLAEELIILAEKITQDERRVAGDYTTRDLGDFMSNMAESSFNTFLSHLQSAAADVTGKMIPTQDWRTILRKVISVMG